MSEQHLSSTKTLSMPMAIIIAGALVALAIYFSNTAAMRGAKVAQTPTPSAAATVAAVAPTQLPVDVKNIKTDGEPFIGDANAPVTLVYWSDYQCPFCKKFEESSFQNILNTYVKTNKVKVVVKDFAFLGSDSTDAALAARAVWETAPTKFLAWREAMFLKQDDEGDQGFGDKESIIALTKTISGIDANKVSALMDSKKAEYTKIIDADQAEAKANGVNGTPGFITGTVAISGAQPYATFSAALDAQLK